MWTPDNPVAILWQGCWSKIWASKDIIISHIPPVQFRTLCTLHEELAWWDDVIVGVWDICIVTIPPGWWFHKLLLLLLLLLLEILLLVVSCILLMLLLLLLLMFLQLLIHILDKI